MKIALASPRIAPSVADGLHNVAQCLATASEQGAKVVCFPEAYLPGLRGLDFVVPPFDHALQVQTLDTVAQLARQYGIAIIIGMERYVSAGRQIVSYVINASGDVLGCQTKNQLDPSEEAEYVPGNTRELFEVDGLKFGIAICHEGWRYPETVRWAAARGAHIVFHPQHTGSDIRATFYLHVNTNVPGGVTCIWCSYARSHPATVRRNNRYNVRLLVQH